MTADPPPRSSPRKSRRGWVIPLVSLALLLLLEGLARQFIARPVRIVRPSADRDIVYESTPGQWLGHAKYDVWRAPLYMVLDFVHTPGDAPEGDPPAGYTLYRIDGDGCRGASRGPIGGRADTMIVGSSLAFGLLVPQEQTVGAALEQQLQQTGHPDAHVANCSVVGHHLLPGLAFAERALAAKDPRLVVFLVRPWHLVTQLDYTKVVMPQNRVWRWIMDRSNIARLVFYAAHREPSQFQRPLVPRADLAAALDRFSRAVTPHHARVLFFLLDDHSPQCALYAGLEQLLDARGFAHQRVAFPLERREYFVDHEQHWSGLGARVVADEMWPHVLQAYTQATTPTP